MRLSVVIPVHNGGENFRCCLRALKLSMRLPDEIIVVDDFSTDDSASIAREAGVRVLSLVGNEMGPAIARNRGANISSGDAVIFCDADITVHTDALAKIERVLLDFPDVDAVFGSYDAAPPVRNAVSLYKNLFHYYTHQHAAREAETFWAGCGAIRIETFRALGGFSERYRSSCIEDIELGVRMRQAGHRVWLCPEIQATHLKAWTLVSLLRTDIFSRAIPWSRLILSRTKLPNTLNLNWSNRWSAICACVGLAFIPLGIFYPLLWIFGALAGLGVAALNLDLYRVFFVSGGGRFMISAIVLHWLYLVYSPLAFCIVYVSSLAGRRRA
jgi:glycosyltransferase involved in cell wall biosynthesis